MTAVVLRTLFFDVLLDAATVGVALAIFATFVFVVVTVVYVVRRSLCFRRSGDDR